METDLDSIIPKEYLEFLKHLIHEKRYAVFSLIIQNGVVVGVDTTIKERREHK